MKYAHTIAAAQSVPWAIIPGKLNEIAMLLARKAHGEASDVKIEARASGLPSLRGSVGILPIHGVLVPRGNMISESSGATSVDVLSARLREMVASPHVDAIVLDIDSPGGSVAMIPEFAAQVAAARESKRIVASVNTLAASAAYWIASQADTIMVSPSGDVGSIGVIALHMDASRFYDAKGLTPTLITAGKFKAEGNEFMPLSDEARAAIQSDVDHFYGMFVDAVAKGRGVSAKEVRAGYGEGRTVVAKAAVASGMADKIGTLDDAVSSLMRVRGKTPNRARAEIGLLEMEGLALR